MESSLKISDMMEESGVVSADDDMGRCAAVAGEEDVVGREEREQLGEKA